MFVRRHILEFIRNFLVYFLGDRLENTDIRSYSTVSELYIKLKNSEETYTIRLLRAFISPRYCDLNLSLKYSGDVNRIPHWRVLKNFRVREKKTNCPLSMSNKFLLTDGLLYAEFGKDIRKYLGIL